MYYKIYYNNKRSNNLITVALLLLSIGVLLPLLVFPLSGVFGIFDELLLIIFFTLIVSDIIKLRIHKTALAILSFIFILVCLSYLSPFTRNLGLTVYQSILHVKFFIIFYVFNSLFTDVKLRPFFVLLVLLTFFGIICNIILPSFFKTEDDKEVIRFVSFISRIQGFQGQANSLSYFLTIVLTIGLFYISEMKSSFKIVFYISFTVIVVFAVLLTGGRSPLFFLPLILFFTLKDQIKLSLNGIIMIMVAGVGFLMLLILTWDTLINKTLDNFDSIAATGGDFYNPRGFLFFYGSILFYDFFPFGTGSATFASTLSMGSKAYNHLGINNTLFVQSTDGLFDSNFACIMGEFGLVGLILFTLLFIYFYRWGIKKYKTKNDRNRFMIIYLFFAFLTLKGNVLMNGSVSLLFSIFLIYPATAEKKDIIETK